MLQKQPRSAQISESPVTDTVRDTDTETVNQDPATPSSVTALLGSTQPVQLCSSNSAAALADVTKYNVNATGNAMVCHVQKLLSRLDKHKGNQEIYDEVCRAKAIAVSASVLLLLAPRMTSSSSS